MDPKTKAAFENMQFYKFYPVQTLDTPDISSVKVCSVRQILLQLEDTFFPFSLADKVPYEREPADNYY